MGWNDFTHVSDHPVLKDINKEDHVYYVHSNAMVTDNPVHELAASDYATNITAVIGRDNMIGTQFHPEKKPSDWPASYS